MAADDLSPMAVEMKKAVLELPGIKPADIDRVIAVLVACEAIMLEAMQDFVADTVKKRFVEVFSIGFGTGVCAAIFIALLGHWLS